MSPSPTPSGTVLLFDRTTRLRMRFSGPKAGESLTGLVTNDVLSLRGGDGLYACALTAKGRIIADVRILAVAPEAVTSETVTSDAVASDAVTSEAAVPVATYLVDANAAAGVGFAAMIRKYVNPRLAKYADITADTACLTLSGTGALALLRGSAANGDVLDALADGAAFTHRVAQVGGVEVRAARVPDLGHRESIDLTCAAADATALSAALTAAGATPASDDAWHRLRVQSGRPEWGVDMDEGTLAQEANMDALEAISYRKGCYTGQETVARVHFRGHVNRTLRRLAHEGTALPPRESELRDAGGAVVGTTRSAARDEAGQGISLAMVRREVSEDTTLLWTDTSGAEHRARVTDAAAAD